MFSGAERPSKKAIDTLLAAGESEDYLRHIRDIENGAPYSEADVIVDDILDEVIAKARMTQEEESDDNYYMGEQEKE